MTGTADPAGPQRRWAQVPGVPAGPGAGPARDLLATAVAVVGPVARLWSIAPVWRAAVGTVLCLVVAGVVQRVPVERWQARLAVAAAGGAVLVPLGGRVVGLWLVGAIVLTEWAIRDRPPLPVLPRVGTDALVGVTVVLLVAAWKGRVLLATADPFGWMVVALLLIVVAAVLGGTLARVVERVGHAVGRALSAVGFAVVGVVVVVVPWLVQRVARIDPLEAPHPSGSAWLPRRRRHVRPASAWTTESVEGSLPLWSRARRVAVVAVVPVLVVGLAAVPMRERVSSWWSQRDGGGAEVPGAVGIGSPGSALPAAYADAPWYDIYREDMHWIWHTSTAWNPLGPLRVRDVTTRTVNVSGGVRRSWRPPDCECRRVLVWMYGGSTTFGLGQRDEHTIASELARRAWEDGIALDVANRGTPGDMHWEEAQRYAWDVARHGPPDLVLFYDGVNEVSGTYPLVEEGQGDVLEPSDLLSRAVRDVIGYAAPDPAPDPPEGAELPSPPRFDVPGDPVERAEAVGRLAVTRYLRSLTMSRDVSTANRVPTYWFWQPSIFSRPPLDGEPQWDDGGVAGRRRDELMRSLLPSSVHDLTDVLARRTEPMFTDEWHHNEEGARLLAAAIYEVLEPELRELAAA